MEWTWNDTASAGTPVRRLKDLLDEWMLLPEHFRPPMSQDCTAPHRIAQDTQDPGRHILGPERKFTDGQETGRKGTDRQTDRQGAGRKGREKKKKDRHGKPKEGSGPHTCTYAQTEKDKHSHAHTHT